MTDGEIRKLANDAAGIVTSGRADQYGKPENSFEIIAALWSGYIKARWDIALTIRAADVARMMELLKMGRRMGAPMTKLDSFVDGIGYILCEARITVDEHDRVGE